MLKRKHLALAIAVIAMMGFYPQVSEAQGLTGKQFITWERAQQDSYIRISVTMTAVVATRGHSNIAQCIDEWYSEKTVDEQARHDTFIEAIKKNTIYHPQAVILALIQKQCGSFDED